MVKSVQDREKKRKKDTTESIVEEMLHCLGYKRFRREQEVVITGFYAIVMCLPLCH